MSQILRTFGLHCIEFVSRFDSQRNTDPVWKNCNGTEPKQLLMLSFQQARCLHLKGEVPSPLSFVYYGILIVWDGGHNLRSPPFTSPLNTAVHMGTSTELPAGLKTLLFLH